jgi:hypothetical protein
VSKPALWRQSPCEYPSCWASDTDHFPTVRGTIDICPHRSCFRVVGRPRAEVAVDVKLVFRLGIAQGGDHVTDFLDDRDNLVLAQAVAGIRDLRWCWLVALLGEAPFGLGLGDPAGYDGGVRAGVQRRAVTGQLGVALRDRWLGGYDRDGVGRGDAGLVEELGNGVATLQGTELLRQPCVQRVDEDLLPA